MWAVIIIIRARFSLKRKKMNFKRIMLNYTQSSWGMVFKTFKADLNKSLSPK